MSLHVGVKTTQQGLTGLLIRDRVSSTVNKRISACRDVASASAYEITPPDIAVPSRHTSTDKKRSRLQYQVRSHHQRVFDFLVLESIGRSC